MDASGVATEDESNGLVGTSLDSSAKYGVSLGRSMVDEEAADKPTNAGLVRTMEGAKALDVSESIMAAIVERTRVVLDRGMLAKYEIIVVGLIGKVVIVVRSWLIL